MIAIWGRFCSSHEEVKCLLKFLKFPTITTTQMRQLWDVKKIFVFCVSYFLYKILCFVWKFVFCFQVHRSGLVKVVFSNLLLKFSLFVFLKCFLFLPDLSLTFLIFLFLIQKTCSIFGSVNRAFPVKLVNNNTFSLPL